MNWIRKHWAKFVAVAIGGTVLVVVLILAAPTIIGYGPVRNFLLHHLFNGNEVVVTVDTVSVGWFQTTTIENLHVEQKEKKYDFRVPLITNDVSLFQLISRPRQLGNLVIEEPKIVIHLPDEKSDLFNDGPGTAPSIDEQQLQTALSRTIDVSVIDASVQVYKPGAKKPWGFENIAFLAQLRPGATQEEGPSLLIPEATLMNRKALTQEMCDDMLKFVAPIVTGVTKIDGEVSLALEDIRVPLADRKRSVGKGTLNIHQANLTGAPLVQKITNFLGVGSSVQVFTDCAIRFQLADRRIYHEGLDFGVGNLRIRTHGYVGLDESLDLIAEVPIPLAAEKAFAAGEIPNPIIESLRGKTIEIHIVGTLDKPQIDAQSLSQSLLTTAESTLREMLQDDNIDLNLRGEDGEIEIDEILDLSKTLLESARREGGLMDQLRERREAMQNAEDPNQEDPTAAKPGLFRRLLRQAQQSLVEPDDADAAEPPAVPVPVPDPSGAIDL
ncbi:hypothetical protein [Blastopirellula marina]|uniref:Uncharacterized protein n=1 Tax=Blastopirellula marina TaxID=124 RepID=A0A2S8GNX9_9BACT|nr:hypothetical protein [Blastopirellula marina]PQO46128.1 hypothetical protein C5Y93_11185 [Blastopirellula marina]